MDAAAETVYGGDIRMTKIGYKDIRERIQQILVEPPKDTAGALTNWLNRYRQCYCDVIDVLAELEKGDPQARD